jgi:hypothetical protein
MKLLIWLILSKFGAAQDERERKRKVENWKRLLFMCHTKCPIFSAFPLFGSTATTSQHSPFSLSLSFSLLPHTKSNQDKSVPRAKSRAEERKVRGMMIKCSRSATK